VLNKVEKYFGGGGSTSSYMDTDEPCEDMQVVAIPTTIYFYREIKGYGEYSYKIEQIVQKTERFTYKHCFVEKNRLDDAGMAQIEIFNSIYIPHMNQQILKFAFRCESGVYLCVPNTQGKLQVVAIEPNNYQISSVNQSGTSLLATSDLACSVYTIIHDYIETRSNDVFYHVGASPLPCTGFFIPTWISSKTLVSFLIEWNISKMNIAKNESIVVVRCSSGLTTVKKVIDTKKKWKQLIFSGASYED
jgi:hypothetical protein